MNINRPNRGILYTDKFWFGLIVGLCFPIVSYGILLTVIDFADQQILPPDVMISQDFRERTLSVIAICFNLIPFHFYQRKYADNTMRGMVIPTVMFVGLWFWIYGLPLLGY